MEPFIGEIKIFGGNFAPRDYAFCQGQLLSIAQNTALFSLLGTTYGGNGQTTFALPDLRGRSPVGFGQGPGLHDIILGEAAGSENVTLTTAQLPMHNVQVPGQSVPVSISGAVAVPASSSTATSASPVNSVPAAPTNAGRPFSIYGSAQSGSDTLAPFDVTLNGSVDIPATQSSPVGGSQPVALRPPYLGVNFIIALQGIFPSRN